MTENTKAVGSTMNREEFREAVKMDVPSDAVTVTKDGDTTIVELFYLEPETQVEPMRDPFSRGILLAVRQPDTDKLMSEVIDDIQLSSSPDDWEIEDKNGFFVVTLTYEDGRTW